MIELKITDSAIEQAFKKHIEKMIVAVKNMREPSKAYVESSDAWYSKGWHNALDVLKKKWKES